MMLSSVLFPSIRLKWRSLGVSACYFFTVQWIFTPNPWSTSMLFAGVVCSFRSAFLCRILYFYFSSFFNIICLMVCLCILRQNFHVFFSFFPFFAICFLMFVKVYIHAYVNIYFYHFLSLYWRKSLWSNQLRISSYEIVIWLTST